MRHFVLMSGNLRCLSSCQTGDGRCWMMSLVAMIWNEGVFHVSKVVFWRVGIKSLCWSASASFISVSRAELALCLLNTLGALFHLLSLQSPRNSSFIFHHCQVLRIASWDPSIVEFA
jgi:hypothetical protein